MNSMHDLTKTNKQTNKQKSEKFYCIRQGSAYKYTFVYLDFQA